MHIAHKTDTRTQPLIDHLTAVSQLAGKYAAPFGLGEASERMGYCHDIGKYSAEFQSHIESGDNAHIDHSTAGALELRNLGDHIPAMCVAGHHAGLLDFGTYADQPGSGTYNGRINKAKIGDIPDYSECPKLPADAKPVECESMEDIDFTTRMLFSCLVDADWTDTDRFCNGTKPKEPVYLITLFESFQRYVSRWVSPKTNLDKKRWEILNTCYTRGAVTRNGLYTLTAPTGGGKTAASLAFAISHAIHNRKERIIYVVPYNAIIEQTADTFRAMLGDENVLEHHSGIEYDLEDERGRAKLQATETWDAPVIVTTAVQFFESIYSNKPSKCRKIHRIANSVVVFDEAQTLPTLHLNPCISAICQLVRNYNTTAVLCTATQPALREVVKRFADFTPEEIIGEIAHGIPERVTYQDIGETTLENLALQLQEESQVLCIVNTRRTAKTLYDLVSGEGTYHLSTWMYPNHRRKVLAEIKERLQDGKPCRVVSTSLIEAGVDIDFLTIFRELSGLDSIIQAAGRCNREGKRSKEESIVTVFSLPGNPPKSLQPNIAATKNVMERFENWHSQEAVTAYFADLYEMRDNDTEAIIPKMQTLSFAKIAESFCMIGTSEKTIFIQTEESEPIIRSLTEYPDRAKIRKLQKYGVSVYESYFEELKASGAIYEAVEGIWVLAPQNADLYREDTGMMVGDLTGCALIV